MRLFLISLCSLWASTALAVDLSNVADYPQLPRYAGSQISDYQAEQSMEQRYPLAALRRLGGQLRYERELLVSGQGSTLIYALARGDDHRAAFAHGRETLRENGFELLFWCEGRECGSSALWANNVFENAALNGGDDQQAFALLRKQQATGDQLMALYAVTRGNRRAYLLAQQMQVADLGEQLPVAATLLRLLRNNESLTLPALELAQNGWLALLAQTLNQDITLRALLQGEGAQAWRDALVAAGVRASRLEADELAGQALELTRVR